MAAEGSLTEAAKIEMAAQNKLPAAGTAPTGGKAVLYEPKNLKEWVRQESRRGPRPRGAVGRLRVDGL